MQFAAFSDRVPLKRPRGEVWWVCVSMRFPCWQADHVILAPFTPERDPPVLSRHTSLDFLNEEEKTVLGLAADLCSRDFEFIHLKDAYSFGIYYPPPSPQCQAEWTDHFYFVTWRVFFPGLKIFVGETSFLDIKSNALGDLLSFACAFVLRIHFTERDFCVQT